MSRRSLGLALSLIHLTALMSVGCDLFKGGETDEVTTESEPSASISTIAAGVSSAAPDASASAPKEDYGEVVTIPAGELKAGSKCLDVPRIRPDELMYESINMGEFQMDLFPYPNDPTKKAMVNVTHEQAAKLCRDRGRRLCTELEWERACKGPKNSTYLWGDGFNPKKCLGQLDLSLGKRDCTSPFGVRDMVGVAMEWTASPWERGRSSGDMVIRGARSEKVSWLSARCAHSRQRSPHKSYEDVGFRCCSGPQNSAKVELRPRKLDTLLGVDIDTPFQMSLFRHLKKEYRQVVDVKLSFDNVYKWHPVEEEEMIVARWVAEPVEGAPYYIVFVYKICGEVAWPAAQMKGPVAELSKPVIGIAPTKLSFNVTTGSNSGTVDLGYWHGFVKVTEPPWIKAGNKLAGTEDEKGEGTPDEKGDTKPRLKLNPDKMKKIEPSSEGDHKP